MNMDTTHAEVMKKVMEILRKHLTREEYLTYLEVVTKQKGDSVVELREKTKNLTIDEIMNQIS
ncbi:MAG: hypothetical protein HXS46_17000 [Theionarchaea archaeon]|nr:hypothetical protein [Theionarchaea archaeon]